MLLSPRLDLDNDADCINRQVICTLLMVDVEDVSLPVCHDCEEPGKGSRVVIQHH